MHFFKLGDNYAGLHALIEQFRDLVGQGLARVEVIQKYNREKILNENPNISGNIDNPNDIYEKLKKLC